MTVSIETFAESLRLLRQALAAADPLVEGAGPADFTALADHLAGTFGAAPPEARLRYLLRALDDAVIAVEIAARLADVLWALDGQGNPVAADAELAGLRPAHDRFAESQPAYQALYHLRNAVAERLRLDQRPIPPAVAAGDAPQPGAHLPESASPPGEGSPGEKMRTGKSAGG